MSNDFATKKCPKCGFINIGAANYCSNRYCDYIFPMPEQSKFTSKPAPHSTSTPKPKTQAISNPVLDFQTYAGKTNGAVNTIIDQCHRNIKPINDANCDDSSMEEAYVTYLANFDEIIKTLDQIKVIADNLQTSYNQHKAKLLSTDHDSIELIELLYQKAYINTIESINGLVIEFSRIRPFDHLKSYLLSPIKEWNDTFTHDDLLSSIIYLGVVCKEYKILGQTFHIERREYLKFLHSNNLVIRYNNATEEQCMYLVATIIGRMLSKSPLRLPVCIIDHDQLGIHNEYRYLPETVYCIETGFDAEEIRELEIICQRHGNLTNNQLFVLKDWYACIGGIRNEEQLKRIMDFGLNTGQCFIVMVNEDTKTSSSPYRKGDEDDLLSKLDHRIELNLINKDGDLYREFDLMSDDLIEKTRKLVQTMDDTIEQYKSVDISELFKNRRERRNCKLKITLYIGKDNKLNDKAIELKDDRIHSSVLVRYDNHSHVFPWMKAMIAEAFKIYGDQQVNVVVADFIGCEELDAIHTIESKQAPFYYYKFKKNSSTYSKVINSIKQFLIGPDGRRMLVFLVGKYEDLKNDFINTKYHDKKNLHLVLLATDVPRDIVWEGYQLTFGPKRLESGPELSEDEFLFENRMWNAYSCKISMIQQLLKDYLPSPQSLKENPKIIKVQAPSPLVKSTIDQRQDEHLPSAQFNPSTLVDSKMDEKEDLKKEAEAKPIVEPTEKETKHATVEQPEEKPSVVETSITPQGGEKPIVEPAEKETEHAIVEQPEEKLSVVETSITPQREEKPEIVKIEEEEKEEFSEIEVEDEEADLEKYDYQRTFYLRDYMTPQHGWWTLSAKEELSIPFGIHINRDSTLDEIWEFRFATNIPMMNAALVLGGQGSGKTAFLRTLIMSAAQRYSPKELEFYLIDFKTTGFEPFEIGKLPHVRVVASAADREFGFSILQRIKQEVTNRMKCKYVLPRVLLVIDECQNFFLDDHESDVAGALLEYILKQGREFGINLILATQELHSSTTRVPQSLYDLIAIRYIAKPSESDYIRLFNRSDREVISLKRSYNNGEALFVEKTYMGPLDSIEEYHTKAFYIETKELPLMIQQVAAYAANHPNQCPSNLGLFTFHNDDDLVDFNAEDRMISTHLSSVEGLPKTIPMYLGQPIAMDNDVFLSLAQKRNQNVLIVSANPCDDTIAQNIAYCALMSSAKAYPTDEAGRATNRLDYIFDFTEDGEPLHNRLDDLVSKAPFGIESTVIEADDAAVTTKLTEITEELEKRKAEKSKVQQHIFLTFLGFDRGDMFDDGEDASEALNTITEEGPKYGIFTIIQFMGDENTLKRQININYRFQHIVALQMSDDSSYDFLRNTSAGQLYDPNDASENHGLYRALYYNITSNSITKFKPYNFYQNGSNTQ